MEVEQRVCNMKIIEITILLNIFLISNYGGLQISAQNTWKSFSGDKIIEHKVDSVLKLMTLDEKVGQMTQFSCNWDVTGPVMKDSYELYLKKGLVGSILNAYTVDGVHKLQEMALKNSRLKIPVLFGYDVIHGYRTIFPIPLAESCSWNLELMKESASIASKEATADGIHWTFAPMVDISRDPRWGRVMEGAGEDTYLGSLIAKARIQGFQGGSDWNSLSNPNTLLACCKHFAAYGAVEGGRDYNSAELSLNTLMEYYLPPYEAAKDAGVATFMAAFNEIGGVPCTSSKWLMTDFLRNQWDFKGFVVSDYSGINELVYHGVAKDEKTAGDLSANAGIDMDMSGSVYCKYLKNSIEEGNVSIEKINNSVRRILEMKFLLGLFNDPYRSLNDKSQKEKTMTPEFLEVARKTAQQSVVLLKNSNNFFPISKDKPITVALIGPLVKDINNQIGAWSARGNTDKCISLYDGLIKKYKNTQVKLLYAEGCNLTGNDKSGFDKAMEIGSKADIILVAMGEPSNYSGESTSRSNIQIPGVQTDLLKELKKLNKPIGLVLSNGRPLDITWEDDNLDAILEGWYLGTMSGYALADIISGDCNPSGRLTMSFPRTVGQIPVYYNHKSTGRPLPAGKSTARYSSCYTDISNTPLYNFGYGLSYTTFAISNLKLDKIIMTNGDKIKVQMDVVNNGNYDGETVVQLYICDLVGSVTRPVKELKGFEKVVLKVGEKKQVNFEISESLLAFYGLDLKKKAEAGDFVLWVGFNSADDNNKAEFTLK